MIVKGIMSVDGLPRRKSVRHISCINQDERILIFHYFDTIINKYIESKEWFNNQKIFPIIPESIIDTPLYIIFERSQTKFPEDKKLICTTTRKLIGIILRDYLNYIQVEFEESFLNGSLKNYRVCIS